MAERAFPHYIVGILVYPILEHPPERRMLSWYAATPAV
jgi:hypothetical protein